MGLDDKLYPVTPAKGTMFDELPALAPEQWAAFLAERTNITDQFPVWVRKILVPALAQAADDSGVIRDIKLPMFFENHVQVVTSEALSKDGDSPVTSDFNSFVGVVLEYAMFALAFERLIFERHNDDNTIDLRLRLPEVAS